MLIPSHSLILLELDNVLHLFGKLNVYPLLLPKQQLLFAKTLTDVLDHSPIVNI